MSNHSFQVNLRGIIDLLANHLYSSPQVFVRELLQNGADAITARQYADPTHCGMIRLELMGGQNPTLLFEDDGVGLSEDELHQFLSTIGESSKRGEDLGGLREQLLGQFGIGLLSCFMVADEIVVITRKHDSTRRPLEWRGASDGTYSIREVDTPLVAGTQVYLRARPETAEYFARERIEELVTHYGGLLPVTIRFARDGVECALPGCIPPWRRQWSSRREETDAVLAFGREMLGIKAWDWIPLRSEAGGVDGVAYVLEHPVGLSAKHTHRVYLRGMLLSERVDNLLPSWTFFVRAIVTTVSLRPTASRESFYEDELLESCRAALGNCVRDYIVGLAESAPAALQELISIHYLGMKALALEDDELFRMIHEWLPFETSLGRMTLGEILQHSSSIRFASTRDQFRQISGIAAAQFECIVNGGYVYDRDLLERLAEISPETTVESVEASSILDDLQELSTADSDLVQGFLRAADQALQPMHCSAIVRRFVPAELPALYTAGSKVDFLRDIGRARDVADDHWEAILKGFQQDVDSAPASSSRLCFNLANPLIRSLVGVADPDLRRTVIETLYVHSLLLGHHPLGATEMNLLNRGLLQLLELGLRAGGQAEEERGG